MSQEKKHNIRLLVANKPGVLIRISLVFARRGYNIDSLVVSESANPRFSIMNISARGDEQVLKQILLQLQKLVDVVTAEDLTDRNILYVELALIKILSNTVERKELIQLAKAMDCEIIDVHPHQLILQVTNTTEKIDAVMQVLDGYEIVEVVRTGKVLMTKEELSQSLEAG